MMLLYTRMVLLILPAGRIRAVQLDYSDAHKNLLQVMCVCIFNNHFIIHLCAPPFTTPGYPQSPSRLGHRLQADSSQVCHCGAAPIGGDSRQSYLQGAHPQETSCTLPAAHSRWVWLHFSGLLKLLL